VRWSASGCTSAEPGCERALAGLAAWLPRYGIDVEVWQLTNRRTPSWDARLNGVRVSNRPTYGRPWAFMRGLTPAARVLVDERQTQVDLVHFYSGLIPEYVAAAARLRTPYVISPQGSYSPAILEGRHRWLKRPWLQLQETAFVRGAQFLHAVSDREADALASTWPGARIDSSHLIQGAHPPYREASIVGHLLDTSEDLFRGGEVAGARAAALDFERFALDARLVGGTSFLDGAVG
jgi:hypothetical protein